jgi:hypothetical protein
MIIHMCIIRRGCAKDARCIIGVRRNGPLEKENWEEI